MVDYSTSLGLHNLYMFSANSYVSTICVNIFILDPQDGNGRYDRSLDYSLVL